MAKLRPCPFCGSPSGPGWTHSADREYVWCMDCGATGPENVANEFVGKAEELWNKRFWETRGQAAKWEV